MTSLKGGRRLRTSNRNGHDSPACHQSEKINCGRCAFYPSHGIHIFGSVQFLCQFAESMRRIMEEALISSCSVLAARRSMFLLLRSFAIRISRTREDANRQFPILSYCRLRKSTFPLTGPSTRAKKRPCSERNTREIPRSAQAPISGVDTVALPKHTMASILRVGTATFPHPRS